MPQKGFKKDDGVRGRREKISSKVFPFFPDHKSTFIGNRAKNNQKKLQDSVLSGHNPFEIAGKRAILP